jgi:hypothetical protein
MKAIEHSIGCRPRSSGTTRVPDLSRKAAPASRGDRSARPAGRGVRPVMRSGRSERLGPRSHAGRTAVRTHALGIRPRAVTAPTTIAPQSTAHCPGRSPKAIVMPRCCFAARPGAVSRVAWIAGSSRAVRRGAGLVCLIRAAEGAARRAPPRSGSRAAGGRAAGGRAAPGGRSACIPDRARDTRGLLVPSTRPILRPGPR